MAKNERKNSDKMSAVCPHCGFTQEESVVAKSTFCRKCQEHYSLERALAGERSIVKAPSLFSKLSRMVLGEREREVCCFACGHKQVLSTSAQSTMCPGCGAYMDLRDFKITSPFGRSVQTAGEVHIAPNGDVTSTRLMCGSAFIEGSLRGSIVCTGRARVKIKGRFTGMLDAQHMAVEKGGDIEFVRLVRTKIFEVNGKARARVVADKVIIGKTGWLEGTVYARAITVEKGGVFSGDLNIGQEEFDVAEEPMETDRHIARFDDDNVAFGPA
ncbi:MAG: polymer-forming cytoskeletal protein [Chthoniobacteraceae bacterium]